MHHPAVTVPIAVWIAVVAESRSSSRYVDMDVVSESILDLEIGRAKDSHDDSKA